ncbi:uncharacterized protein METZ01_LOCUS261892, partial [marine metagenome]
RLERRTGRHFPRGKGLRGQGHGRKGRDDRRWLRRLRPFGQGSHYFLQNGQATCFTRGIHRHLRLHGGRRREQAKKRPGSHAGRGPEEGKM